MKTAIGKAIIYIKHGTLYVEYGHDIDDDYYNFHNKISCNYSGSNEITLKARKVKRISLYETITERDELFDKYCKALVGFEEQIRTIRKFSWKKFRIEKCKGVRNSEFGKSYKYKEEYWELIEYVVNNWVFIQHNSKNGIPSSN